MIDGRRKLLPLALLGIGGILLITLGGGHYLSLAALADNRKWLLGVAARAGPAAPLLFILTYAGLVALSFPAAEVLTMAGGFLFGRWLGTVYAVIGASSGATVVFLAARHGLAGLTNRAGGWVASLQSGFRRNAFNYLLVLRLVPLFPFWLVNLAAGAAGLRLTVFVVGTFLGIIPGAFIYASLGTGLGTLIAQGRRPTLAIVFEPGVLLPLLALAALALLPILYRRWRSHRHGSTAWPH